MNFTFIFVDLFAIICLLLAFIRDREKTKRALIVALKSFLRILPMIIATVILIGLILGFVSEDLISEVIGEQAGLKGVFIVALLGAILHIPSIISFPLAASLLRGGASVTSVAVFITTLTMIGIVTLPVEIRELGRKFAMLRNSLSFIIAILIGLIMGENTMRSVKKISPDLVFLGIISSFTIVLLLTFPEKQEKVIAASWEFFIEMVLILPAVMILMGLFSVFVPKELVVKYLGKESGVKGVFIAIIMGSLPTGPLYIAFPIASTLLKKGSENFECCSFPFSLVLHKTSTGNCRTRILRIEFHVSKINLNHNFRYTHGINV